MNKNNSRKNTKMCYNIRVEEKNQIKEVSKMRNEKKERVLTSKNLRGYKLNFIYYDFLSCNENKVKVSEELFNRIKKLITKDENKFLGMMKNRFDFEIRDEKKLALKFEELELNSKNRLDKKIKEIENKFIISEVDEENNNWQLQLNWRL